MIFNESLFLDWDTGEATSIFTRIQNEEVLLAYLRINNFGDMQPYRAAFGGEMTCIGYPTPEGGGCLGTAYGLYAISAVSGHKEGAWEFLEYYLQLDNYGKSARFPALKRNLEMLIADYRENGENRETGYPDGWTYKHHNPSEEEIAEVYNLLKSVRFKTLNTEVMNIISEEAESFFAGQKPAAEAARIIENRVKLYLEENR